MTRTASDVLRGAADTPLFPTNTKPDPMTFRHALAGLR